MATFKKYTFQQSRIWEAGDPVDPFSRPVTIKGKTEDLARSKLPAISTGRVWVLVKTEEKD